jgi:phage shock protein A
LQHKLEKQIFDSNEEREKNKKYLEKRIDDGLKEVNEKLDGVESSLETDISDMKEEIEGLTPKVDTLEEKVEVLEEKIEENGQRIESVMAMRMAAPSPVPTRKSPLGSNKTSALGQIET